MASIKELTRTTEKHERLKVIARNMLLAARREDPRDLEKSAEELSMWFKEEGEAV